MKAETAQSSTIKTQEMRIQHPDNIVTRDSNIIMAQGSDIGLFIE
jgi:hypothetical protein